MALPYENATSGMAALAEVEKIVARIGVNKFGSWTDYDAGRLVVRFELRGRAYQVEASYKGYAAAWLRENPWTNRRSRSPSDWNRLAYEKGKNAAPSILRDWIKAMATAVEVGLLTFDEAMLPHALTHDGRRLIELVKDHLPALPAPASQRG